MPMTINTNGEDVTFTPYIDNVAQTPTTLNTPVKQTTFHYFSTDVFGIDYSGELVATTNTPFEFYGLEKPEGVEVLPVAKKFDQVNLKVDRLAKLQRLRLRAITEENAIQLVIKTEAEVTLPNMTGTSGIHTIDIPTTPNTDDVWEIMLPKGVYGTSFRFELGPTSTPFHRYELQVLMVQSGVHADPKWVKLK